jgi:hypothetical protein
VLPIGRIDQAIALARDHGVLLCTYADLMRVPASNASSLMKARSQGADVRMVYSAIDALKLAQQHPDREVVFLAIGFETTTPPTASVLRQARALGLRNFSVLCNHVLTPPAMRGILGPPPGSATSAHLHGFIGPAHVSTVIGSEPYRFCADDYHRPVVITGFEPLDVMQAVLMLVRQLNEGRAEIENQFTRSVTPLGNQKAQALMAEVFELRDSFEWRGLGQPAIFGAQVAPRIRQLRRRAALCRALPRGRRCQGLRMRRHPARRKAAAGLPRVRHRLHTGQPDRLVHGVVRRRLRRPLHLRPLHDGDANACRDARSHGMSPVKPGYTRPLDLRHGRIDMSHGSGGRSMVQLIEQIFLSAFDNPALAARDDHAVLATPPELALGGRLVMATDSHVVSPLFFPGGDIGCLSVHGTVNDVAMAGARPLWLSAGFILEEGFPLADLQRIVTSMARAAAEGRRAHRHRRHQGGAGRQGRWRVHQHHRCRRDAPRHAHQRFAGATR